MCHDHPSQDFTRHEAKVAFVYSKMNVIDELKQQGMFTTLTLTDMLEALARVQWMLVPHEPRTYCTLTQKCFHRGGEQVAEMVSMPTEEDLKRVGVADSFQYFRTLELEGGGKCAALAILCSRLTLLLCLRAAHNRRASAEWDAPKTRSLAEKTTRFIELLFGRLDKTGDGKLDIEDLRSWLA